MRYTKPLPANATSAECEGLFEQCQPTELDTRNPIDPRQPTKHKYYSNHAQLRFTHHTQLELTTPAAGHQKRGGVRWAELLCFRGLARFRILADVLGKRQCCSGFLLIK